MNCESEGYGSRHSLRCLSFMRAYKLILGIALIFSMEDSVVVELKALETLLPVHKAQLLSYLRLSGKRVGLLINFHVDRLKDGVTRLVNKF